MNKQGLANISSCRSTFHLPHARQTRHGTSSKAKPVGSHPDMATAGSQKSCSKLNEIGSVHLQSPQSTILFCSQQYIKKIEQHA
jgi:hypothetical protein